MEESIWKKKVRKDASVKDLGPCHRAKRGVYAKKKEGILTIKRSKRGRISGSSDQSKRSRNAEEEGRRSSKLAST